MAAGPGRRIIGRIKGGNRQGVDAAAGDRDVGSKSIFRARSAQSVAGDQTICASWRGGGGRAAETNFHLEGDIAVVRGLDWVINTEAGVCLQNDGVGQDRASLHKLHRIHLEQLRCNERSDGGLGGRRIELQVFDVSSGADRFARDDDIGEAGDRVG